MASHQDTQMGGPGGGFQTTHWTVILDGRRADPAAALSQVARGYWKPVYCYLRRKGLDNDRAKDLTQGFFCEVVLQRQLLDRADPAKGRFRSFLLTCLDRYVVDQGRKNRVRRGVWQPLPQQDEEAMSSLEPAAGGSPEDAFQYAWASSLLDEVLGEVRQQLCGRGKAVHWELFDAHVIQPIVRDAAAPSLEDLRRQRGLATTLKVSNMIETARRRFRACLLGRVRNMVGSPEDAEREIAEMIEILSRPGASAGAG